MSIYFDMDDESVLHFRSGRLPAFCPFASSQSNRVEKFGKP